jgi:hypothetical protein
VQPKTPAITAKERLANTSKWPKIVYDLMGISGASSPENALQRAFESYRKLLPYKYTYDLDNPDEVFEFLEKKAADGIGRAAEAEESLQSVMGDPASIFYETVGADLAAVNWYKALKKTGYAKDFLTLLSETIEKYFEGQGYELGTLYGLG